MRMKENTQQENKRMKEICEAVLRRIKPTDEEIRRVKEATAWIIRQINEKAHELNIPAKAVCVGSVARNTWIRGEEDIDIFILLPEEFTTRELEEKGLRLAKSVFSKYEERYASHPYIHAFFSFQGAEMEADIVPCFEVKSASEIKSAVDRTPFHNAYLSARISGLEDDVRLLKQFLKTLHIYGAEQRTMGFSGYLCELLILHHDGFIQLMKSAAHWRFGHRIDMEGHGTYRGDEPLIVIDPVDPKRNVAASVSAFSFARFIDAARAFISRPSIKYFFREETEMSRDEFIRNIHERGTDFVMLCFDAPPVVDDVLFPQLRKAEKSIRRLIQNNGFSVMRSAVGAEGGKAFLIYEIACGTLPAVKMHTGPPVTAEIHAEKFKTKHLSRNRVVRIDECGRLVAEVPRRHRSVLSLLKDTKELMKCGLGKHVSEIIERSQYEVMINDEIKFFDGLGKFLRKYFNSTVSW